MTASGRRGLQRIYREHNARIIACSPDEIRRLNEIMDDKSIERCRMKPIPRIYNNKVRIFVNGTEIHTINGISIDGYIGEHYDKYNPLKSLALFKAVAKEHNIKVFDVITTDKWVENHSSLVLRGVFDIVEVKE